MVASPLISSILKATSDWLSLIRSTPTTSSTFTGVADNLERLEIMLQRIKAVLVDAEEREIVDESVKLWLKEIKDVAYDTEDLLDEYQHHVLGSQVKIQAVEKVAEAAANTSRKRKHVDVEEEAMSKITILSSMANRIKKISERFNDISNARRDLHLKSEDGKRRHDGISNYPRPTTHMVKEQEIYGREVDRENLINWLFSKKESKFEVLAVVGMGGLGKTTLAQLIFNDQKVKDYFEKRTWICVSEDFNPIKLTRAMIESITEKSCTLSDQLSVLHKSLQKKLKGKRVLLVLDDVWNERKDLWQTLSIPFYDAKIMRIVVTTRNLPVAVVMQTTHPYHLDYLPEEQCWNLFMHYAFSRRNPKQFPWLVDIGKEIVKKCDGLPLAVKSLGGLLQNEEDEDRWKDVLESEVWQSDEETGILPALKLSYIRLPSHLKPCFKICYMYPKDYVFKKDELVKLWVAHGYIQNKVKKNAVEEIGYSYFNELHGRSFFDEFEHYEKQRYKMHDNIHDLAHYVQAERDNKQKIRHLSIIKNESLEFHLDDIGALRTLLLAHSNTIAINGMLLTNLGRLTHLRYLGIKLYDYGSEDKFSLPKEIENLICLRHLELSAPEKKMILPKSISNLYNLALLKIESGIFIKLPENLRNLVSLTTIHLDGFKVHQLPAFGQLPSLRSLTLSHFNKVESIGNEFCRGVNDHHRDAFPSLTCLAFKNMYKWEIWDELQAGDFPRLEKLKIHDCNVLSSTPSLRNFRLLSYMSLVQCDSLQLTTEVQFPPNLKTLKNFRTDSDFQRELCFPKGFRKLKKLERLSGIFGVRIAEVFGILKKFFNHKYLVLSMLRNAHNALNGQAYLREYDGIENLELNWSGSHYSASKEEEILHLVFESGHNEGSHHGDSKNASLSLMDSLRPHANLKELSITDYDGNRYSAWIGDPSFNKLTIIQLFDSKIDQLPTLGQLPSLYLLSLYSISGLKIIGDEFCRSINNSRCHDVVAFPSLISLTLSDMSDLQKWYGLRQGDFPRLQNLSVGGCPRLSSLPDLQNFHLLLDLSIDQCPLIQLPSKVSFLLPNLKTLAYRNCGARMCLSPGLTVENLNGEFEARNNELFAILNNLHVNTKVLTIAALRNVHIVMEAESNLQSRHELSSLTLGWNASTIKNHESFHGVGLVVKDGDDFIADDDDFISDDDDFISDDDGTNQTDMTSFLVLEKFQPHTNLEKLRIEGYNGVGYPSWIGHPSFNKLISIHLRGLKNDQLPTLGQLPSLELLDLHSISRLKRIGSEFCRGTLMNQQREEDKVAFPSLRFLFFKNMHVWDEWHQVLDGDFPKLHRLKIENCPSLRRELISLPPRLLELIYEC